MPENTDEIKQTMSFLKQARTKGIEELNGKIKVRQMTDFDGFTSFYRRVEQMILMPLHLCAFL